MYGFCVAPYQNLCTEWWKVHEMYMYMQVCGWWRVCECIEWNLAIPATLGTWKTDWISEVAGSQGTIGLA